MKNILLTVSSKHPYLAQNVRPLDIYGGGGGGSPAYPIRQGVDSLFF